MKNPITTLRCRFLFVAGLFVRTVHESLRVSYLSGESFWHVGDSTWLHSQDRLVMSYVSLVQEGTISNKTSTS